MLTHAYLCNGCTHLEENGPEFLSILPSCQSNLGLPYFLAVVFFPGFFSALLVYINKSRLYRLHILVSKNRMELGPPGPPPFPFTPLRKILGPKSLPRKGRHCGSWAENCLAVKRSLVQFLAAIFKDQVADNMEAPTWP